MDIGSTTFLARQCKDEKQWTKEKAAKLFTSVRVAGTAAAEALPASLAQGQQGPQDFQKLSEAMLAIQAAASPTNDPYCGGYGCHTIQKVWHGGYQPRAYANNVWTQIRAGGPISGFD